MARERWLPAVGFTEAEVSDRGRVRERDESGRWRIVAPRVGKYAWLSLTDEQTGRRRRVNVAWLVLEAFVGPRPTGLLALHANDIGTDNRLSNLRWDSSRANARDRVLNGRNERANRTRCDHGHDYTAENTRWELLPNGNRNRRCRQCARDRGVEHRRRAKQAARRYRRPAAA